MQSALNDYEDKNQETKKVEKFIDALNPYALSELELMNDFFKKELNFKDTPEEEEEYEKKNFVNYIISKIKMSLPFVGFASILVSIGNFVGIKSVDVNSIKELFSKNSFFESLILISCVLVFTLTGVLLLSYRRWMIKKRKYKFLTWYQKYKEYITMHKNIFEIEMDKWPAKNEIIEFFKNPSQESKRNIINKIHDKDKLREIILFLESSKYPLYFKYKEKKTLILLTLTELLYIISLFLIEEPILHQNLISSIIFIMLLVIFLMFSGGIDAIKGHKAYKLTLKEINQYLQELKDYVNTNQ
ncbi:hypothetical protein QCD85_06300 [Paenibacillus sp. PsM32]|uniref:hypothetical protein n=1 Tax=Paenibacillus sp. PsM32 TaxID=3030536 RepID=UPI00263AFE13|nr:hypothetical protein [Paenibacillus sp. PsM32]MDN4617701.1 hypothetical protein [Paenibacillus sp. PsM32]